MAYPYQTSGPLSSTSVEAVANLMGSTFLNLKPDERAMCALISTLSSLATSQAALAGLGVVPAFSVNPSITGTKQEGFVLTGADGTYDSGTVVQREWLADNVAIAGATGPTFTLTSTQIGALMKYRVTVRNATGPTVATSSATTAVIAA